MNRIFAAVQSVVKWNGIAQKSCTNGVKSEGGGALDVYTSSWFPGSCAQPAVMVPVPPITAWGRRLATLARYWVCSVRSPW